MSPAILAAHFLILASTLVGISIYSFFIPRSATALVDICLERATRLLQHGSTVLLRGLGQLTPHETQQLMECAVSRLPLRCFAWRPLGGLFTLTNIRHLVLDRLIMTHADLRAVLHNAYGEALTQLVIRKAGCHIFMVLRVLVSERNVSLGFAFSLKRSPIQAIILS